MNAQDQHRIKSVVDEVFGKYERWANVKYDGEEITLLEHSLQIAQLAEENGSPVEVVLGAFFHDVGHVLEVEQSSTPKDEWKIEVGKHSETGHRYLVENNFPEAVASAALHHVNAKRYLVYREEDYYNGLSETSKRTLISQGGAMSPKEATKFEALPFFQTIVNVRKWDDKAKVVNKQTPTIGQYKKMCLDYLIGVSA